ncbi:MAG: hypothetical protein F6K40_38615 [Okeania sp. SIO3I5]|uniref:hypothetical protein n=1 Tax=Okeania sp. SIO3I5 TaxID=2607805 RepID=UPI0013BDBA4A|nr:hypothetical protein [Okeania sp. SIO3I5]NEQ41780.1 hypothetical protein [Okeania sp. SIO3I5]
MKPTVVCRHCRYYSPEGRRGGVCQKLMTEVESNWKACSLALSPFAPSWENLNDMVMWHKKVDETLEVVLPVTYSHTDYKNQCGLLSDSTCKC